MVWMQSDERMLVRRKFTIPSKTTWTVAPSDGAVKFIVIVTDEVGMINLYLVKSSYETHI